jgi:acetoacetyl-CoA synthetase
MVHGHGGIVLEHLKSLGLHNDVGPGDVLFWYTSTAWMMWNYVVGGLLRGATVVLYDGAADPETLWGLGREDGVTLFGASPGFYQQSLDRGLPRGPWPELRTLGSTGSPLLEETHRQLTERLPDVLVASVSGGTDVCSGFVGPVPLLPVTAGRMQRPMLGVDCVAFDSDGNVVRDDIGELVVRGPMPSMPLGLWGDDGTRYRETYFARYPGVWCHGDWIRFLPDGEAVITGRSDATLNRGGVRMGTSEFYRVLQTLPWIRDALVVDASSPAGEGRLVLFVVADEPTAEPTAGLSDERTAELRAVIRSRISPRHVPDLIVPVPEVPYTLTGKKCEIPVKRLLLGARPDEVADPESLRNPAALTAIVDAARALTDDPAPDPMKKEDR